MFMVVMAGSESEILTDTTPIRRKADLASSL